MLLKYIQIENSIKQAIEKDLNRNDDVEITKDNIELYIWPQRWGNTAMGFEEIGRIAITDAYTVVIIGPLRDYCVYIGGRLAHHLIHPKSLFFEDFKMQWLEPKRNYGTSST